MSFNTPHGQSLVEYSPGKSGDDSMCVVEFQLTGTDRPPHSPRSDTLAGGEIPRLLRVTTPIILQEWGYNSQLCNIAALLPVGDSSEQGR